jgi:hypothetical protein
MDPINSKRKHKLMMAELYEMQPTMSLEEGSAPCPTMNARQNAHTIRKWQHWACSNRNLKAKSGSRLKIRVLDDSLKFVDVYFCLNSTQPYKMLLKLALLFSFAIFAKRLADLLGTLKARQPPASFADAPTQTSGVVASEVRCSFNDQNSATGDCLVAFRNPC